MKSFQKIPLFGLALASANLCRSFGNLDHQQNAVLHARDLPTPLDAPKTTPAVNGDLPGQTTPGANGKPADTKPKAKGIRKPKSKAENNDNKEEPVKKLEGQIKKLKADLKHSKKKLAQAQDKLKALKNETDPATLPKDSGKNSVKLGGSQGDKNKVGGSKGDKNKLGASTENNESGGSKGDKNKPGSKGDSNSTTSVTDINALPAVTPNQTQPK